MGTSLAVELIAEHTLESILNDIMPIFFLKEGLYFFHQLVEKLVSIALDNWVYRGSFISNERIAEFFCIEASICAMFEPCKNLLILENFIIGWGFLVSSTFDRKEVLPEMRNGKELLGQAIEVTSSS